MQTGGFGLWGRSFGAFAHYVDSFKIVLADGSLHTVTDPKKGDTSKLNDDLFYAVLGGASGSYGVIVGVTLNTVNEDDYYSFYWEVNFLYDPSTLGGIKDMLRKYAEIAGDADDDTRWTIYWSLVGAKTLLNASPTFGPVFPGQGWNYFQIDLAWAVPKAGLTEDAPLAEAQAFYNSIVDACTDCIALDDYLENLSEDTPQQVAVKAAMKASFSSARAASAPISQLYQELTLFDFHCFGVDPFPYTSSWQQGPTFPNEDDMEEILERIDAVIPKIGNEPVFAIAQLAALPSTPFADSSISLPFQEDAFGVTLDVWDLTQGALDFRPQQRHLQEHVMEALGGVDHRMFWNAYEHTCLECGEWEKYYESRPKYNQLVQIKRCVDPDNVFQNRMSMPLNPLNGE